MPPGLSLQKHRVNDGLNIIVTHPILVMYNRIVAAVSFDRNLLLVMGPSGILNLKVLPVHFSCNELHTLW